MLDILLKIWFDYLSVEYILYLPLEEIRYSMFFSLKDLFVVIYKILIKKFYKIEY